MVLVYVQVDNQQASVPKPEAPAEDAEVPPVAEAQAASESAEQLLPALPSAELQAPPPGSEATLEGALHALLHDAAADQPLSEPHAQAAAVPAPPALMLQPAPAGIAAWDAAPFGAALKAPLPEERLPAGTHPGKVAAAVVTVPVPVDVLPSAEQQQRLPPVAAAQPDTTIAAAVQTQLPPVKAPDAAEQAPLQRQQSAVQLPGLPCCRLCHRTQRRLPWSSSCHLRLLCSLPAQSLLQRCRRR